MSTHQSGSWLQRLYRLAIGCLSAPTTPAAHDRPADEIIMASDVTVPGAISLRSLEDWHDVIQQGRRVTLTWDGGPRRGTMTVQGRVRLTFEEAIWIWLERPLPETDRPTVGQAVQVLSPGDGAMRLLPSRLVDEGRGSSLQVSVSGRLTRLQRRNDVRAKVDLPPASAVRISPSGRPLGLIGLHLLDLSAGGVRVRASEPLTTGDRLRLALRLDDGLPLSPTVGVLIGGQFARGSFDPMPESERRRIVQYVYRQELAGRKQAQAAAPAD